MSTFADRFVVIHYHIFKNAGTTLDSMLEKTFGKQWGSYDKSEAASLITPQEMGDFIKANPGLKAVSSHHAIIPLPEITGVDIIPVLFLRHPLDRARSVYDFERRQGQEFGAVSKGAEHAARLSFADYLRWRLDTTVNGVVHNFQTVRLIHDRRFNRHHINDNDFALAVSKLRSLPFFGLVEYFEESVSLLGVLMAQRGIPFSTEYQVKNRSTKTESSLNFRLKNMRSELGEQMWQELIERNRKDLLLYELAEQDFLVRSGCVNNRPKLSTVLSEVHSLPPSRANPKKMAEEIRVSVRSNQHKPEYVLHIGRHKSGTTSLQHFLVKNEAKLKATGVCYPRTMRKPVAHHKLAMLSNPKRLSSILEGEKDQLKREYTAFLEETRQEELVLISSEEFQNCPPNIVAKNLPGKTKIVVYIREQVDYLVSAYSQAIQNQKITYTLEEFERKVFRADYSNFLEAWAERYSQQALIVRIFDRSEMVKSDIRYDFLDVLNLKNLGGSLNFEDGEKNPSIGGAILEFKRRLNREDFERIVSQPKLSKLLQQVAISYPKLCAGVAISPSLAQHVADKYTISNQMVRDKYFPGRTVLFRQQSISGDVQAWDRATFAQVADAICAIDGSDVGDRLMSLLMRFGYGRFYSARSVIPNS